MTFRIKLALAFFASFAVFACSTSDADPTSTGPDSTNTGGEPPAVADDSESSSEDEIAFAETELRACNESYARKWFVSLDGRACADVPGYRGKWIAMAVDDGAMDSVCTMTWQGEKYSRADMDALRAFVKETDAMTAACGSTGIGDAYLTPIPQLDVIAQIGANGCDVCGKLRRDGKIIVVLPPFRTASRQFEVPLSNGKRQAFQINAAQGAKAVAVQLPALPEGVTYAASRVTVY
jgi:hypothetical protein